MQDYSQGIKREGLDKEGTRREKATSNKWDKKKKEGKEGERGEVPKLDDHGQIVELTLCEREKLGGAHAQHQSCEGREFSV